jgi:hypothetical protein
MGFFASQCVGYAISQSTSINSTGLRDFPLCVTVCGKSYGFISSADSGFHRFQHFFCVVPVFNVFCHYRTFLKPLTTAAIVHRQLYTSDGCPAGSPGKSKPFEKASS